MSTRGTSTFPFFVPHISQYSTSISARPNDVDETADTTSAAQMWYCTSKKYAELAAFETQKRVGASYSLAAINPPSQSNPSPDHDAEYRLTLQ